MDPDAVLDRRVDHCFYRSKQRVTRKRQRLSPLRYREELTFMNYYNGRVIFNTIPKLSDSGVPNTQFRVSDRYVAPRDGYCHCSWCNRPLVDGAKARAKEIREFARFALQSRYDHAPGARSWYWGDVFGDTGNDYITLKPLEDSEDYSDWCDWWYWNRPYEDIPAWEWEYDAERLEGRETDLLDLVVPSREERRRQQQLRQAFDDRLLKQHVDLQSDDWVELLSDIDSDCVDNWDLCD